MLKKWLCLWIGLFGTWAFSETISIDIIGGQQDYRKPLFFEGFLEEASCSAKLTPTIKNDLLITGLLDFTKAPTGTARLTGQIQKISKNQCKIDFLLQDRQKILLSEQKTFDIASASQTAHTIADKVYYILFGFGGIFESRIVYIKRIQRKYILEIADVNGERSQKILESNAPIISPAWSFDGKKLAYVSFEHKKPVVYVHDLIKNKRYVVADSPGSNSAPAWHPSGKMLAVTLTLNGYSQIYVIDEAGKNEPKLLTSSRSIDTEAAWSPDGQKIIFVSDRSGRPQIYQVNVEGGTPQRLTFEGTYNVSPKVSPDGKSFTYVSRQGNHLLIMIQDFDSHFPRLLSQGYFNERPSFSPNGQLVLYASEVRGKSVLHAVTIDGASRTKIGLIESNIQDPAWGPIPRTESVN